MLLLYIFLEGIIMDYDVRTTHATDCRETFDL